VITGVGELHAVSASAASAILSFMDLMFLQCG
jgi:hypothetical protein